ncbi:hypothetical protein BO70DRAFT_358168 [Aspergillus heteromorphus CBS 117.55]|uniref:Uncharacterized protein n=1 Tax=Aspergillus heteromorphus CBS 117.55 TaxID=1448321 RepID=A0A317X196_9EURO|nr:uncharacterized protein BO70DRAFT_358168 [Aspergillus heteromorphus CBS 117.55]PWY90718.1 hypothetical protein BO70DRAFT_358168 [Aspergillus heteromorphus CBS 117.55]
MPVASLCLLALSTDATTFLHSLRSTRTVIVASRPRHVVIRPTDLDKDILTKTPWDLLVLIQPPPDSPSMPPSLQLQIKTQYHVTVGIPSKLLTTYPSRDEALKRNTESVPLTGSLDHACNKPSSQNLELSPELVSFMDKLTTLHPGPVTMLNLLHFRHPDGKKSYYQYGQSFVPVAGKRGGDAKLVGNVVKPRSTVGVEVDSRGGWERKEEEWWNEISIVHYPSIRHFCDMLAGEDYQEINEKYRLSALKDTLLLCTTEFDVESASSKL